MMPHRPAKPHSTRFEFKQTRLASLLLALASPCAATAAPSVIGSSGFINMPDARIGTQGDLGAGYAYFKPYSVIWTNLAFTSWLEGTFRYTRIAGVPGFGDERASTYGAYKDKSFAAKLLLLPESEWTPAIAVGKTDLTGTNEGTQLYDSKYLVASKRLGSVDLGLGYGQGRTQGLFGGARWKLTEKQPLYLVAEYDANNYKHDIAAASSGADKKRKGPSYGVEYKFGLLSTQLSYQHNTLGVNAYFTAALDAPEFAPKIDEPAPFMKPVARPTLEQWQKDAAFRNALVLALYEENFRGIKLQWRDGVLDIALTNTRISSMSRAVGRAARIALAHSPVETREIQITYTVSDQPTATYNFYNLDDLQLYFWGHIPRSKLAQSVKASLARPDAIPENEAQEALAAAAENHDEKILRVGDDPTLIALRSEENEKTSFSVRPHTGFFFNDPSGAFKYDLSLLGSASHNFGNGWVAQGSTQLELLENVSDVKQPSNSELPHVRSDVADYKRGNKFKLNRLLLNKYFQVDQGVYGRASAGIYEEMFNGVGTQFLYFPSSSPWAADLAVDWVKQRDPQGWLATRPYSTVTSIASLHYRLPDNITATARAGRFLAKDEGVRFEISKRYQSGIEVGAWLTATNGHDVTSPGSPASPYKDKGIFITIPFSSLRTKDTQASGGFALSPWTRDVGQMVASPGDLYSMFERNIVHGLFNRDGLSGFGDIEDDYPVPRKSSTLFDMPLSKLAAKDAKGLGALATESSTWENVAIAGGLIGVAALADKSTANWSEHHLQGSRWNKVGKVGNAVPYLGLAVGGLAAVAGGNDRLTLAGTASVEAGLSAVLVSSGLKYAAGRTRPIYADSPGEFKPGSSGDKYGSFPSRHTMVAWATLTPLAQAYDANWLYGVAALTNFSRVRSREHWLSDTVASSLIGYGLGSLTWSWRKSDGGMIPKEIGVTKTGVSARWTFK